MSKISPPIFVHARKTFDASQRNRTAYLEPFLPDSLEKPFIKKERRVDEFYDIPIENSIEGLQNFFTAKNIRKKVPYFASPILTL